MVPHNVTKGLICPSLLQTLICWLDFCAHREHCHSQWSLTAGHLSAMYGCIFIKELHTVWRYWAAAYISGLVQKRRNSSALAMELRLSHTNPSILPGDTCSWVTDVIMPWDFFSDRDKIKAGMNNCLYINNGIKLLVHGLTKMAV